MTKVKVLREWLFCYIDYNRNTAKLSNRSRQCGGLVWYVIYLIWEVTTAVNNISPPGLLDSIYPLGLTWLAFSDAWTIIALQICYVLLLAANFVSQFAGNSLSHDKRWRCNSYIAGLVCLYTRVLRYRYNVTNIKISFYQNGCSYIQAQ